MNIISGAYGSGALAADKTTLENKMAAGLNWAETMSNINGAVYGTAEAASAAAIIASVTSDTSTVTAAAATTAAFFAAGGGEPGTTYTLTTDVEEITGTAAGDTITGLFGADNGAGDDTTTVSDGDIIDGAGGSDVLSILVRDDQSEANVFSLSNVETVEIRDLDGVNLDAADWEDVTTLKFYRSSADSAIDNVQNGVTIALDRIEDDVSVTYDDDALDSDSYVQAVTLYGENDTVLTMTTGGDDVVTEVSIVANGDSAVALAMLGTSADTMETLTVSGTGDVEITEQTTAFDALSEVDGSGLAGGLTIVLTNSAEDVTLTGGSGDDVITSSGGDDEISTGSGDDEVTVAAAGDVTVDTGSGDDTVVITAGGLDGDDDIDGGTGTNTIEVDADDLDALETAIIDDENVTNFSSLLISGAAAAAVTFDADSAGISVIELGVDVTEDLGIDSFDGGILIISENQDDLVDVTSDELTLSLADNVTSVDEFTATGTTDLVINSDADGAVTIDAFDIDDVENLTITGDQDLDLDTSATASALVTVDASDFTGVLALDLDDSEGVEITLGDFGDASALTLDADESASDTIVITGDLENDITINNFTAGSGVAADVIDLSDLGVDRIGDLDFTDTGADIEISSDLFDGVITLAGVANINDLTVNNFIFS